MWPYDRIMEFGSLLDKVCQIREHGYIVHGRLHQISYVNRLFGCRHVQVTRSERQQGILSLAAFRDECEPKR